MDGSTPAQSTIVIDEGSLGLIVVHEKGHRYYTWTKRRDAEKKWQQRRTPSTVKRHGEVVLAMLVPESVRLTIRAQSDWDAIAPSTPGVEVLFRRSPVGAV